MSKRLWMIGLAVAAVTALSGCVVVPAHSRHGYGYYEGGYVSGGYVRPAPPPRHYPYYPYRGRGW